MQDSRGSSKRGRDGTASASSVGMYSGTAGMVGGLRPLRNMSTCLIKPL